MKRGLVIVNVLLLLVFGIGCISMARNGSGFTTMLGAGIWLLLPILSLAALRADSTPSMVRAAFWTNIVGLGIAVIAGVAMARKQPNAIVGMIVLALPFAWNVYASSAEGASLTPSRRSWMNRACCCRSTSPAS